LDVGHGSLRDRTKFDWSHEIAVLDG